MENICQLNKTFTQIVPAYGYVSGLAAQSYQKSMKTLSTVCETSQQKVDVLNKSLKQYRSKLNVLLSSSADEFLDILEEKLEIPKSSTGTESVTPRKARIQRILKKFSQSYIEKACLYSEKYGEPILKKGKQFSDQYVLPLYISIKAVFLVSKEMLSEMIEQQLQGLKMTYEVSKDTVTIVTMMLHGNIDHEKVLKKVESNMESFKQLTIKVVQRGLQIKISKKEFFDNYQEFLVKLLDVFRDIKTKGKEQITETKAKTLNLYKSVLNRIKEKEIQIRAEFVKKVVPEIEMEPLDLPKIEGQVQPPAFHEKSQ